MSEVISEVGGVEPERVVIVETGRTWPARSPSSSLRPRSSRRRARRWPVLVAAACAAPYFRLYTGLRRRRNRGDLRRGEERHRAGRRHGRGHGHGRQPKASIITRGLAETMRLGMAPRWGGPDVRRARRGGRPHRDACRRCRATTRSGCASGRAWPSRRSLPSRSRRPRV